MNAALLLGFVVAAVVIIVVPGPAVLFTLGRSIAYGRRAGIASVAGVTLASLVLLAVVAAGLGALVTASPVAMLVIRYAGAAYLLYLGVATIVRRKRHATVEFDPASRPPLARILRQGFTVGLTNPKAIAFFAAVLPQFVDPRASWPPIVQLLVYGAFWALFGFCSDSVWALAAGSARDWFARTPTRIEALTAIGGALLVALAVILALLP